MGGGVEIVWREGGKGREREGDRDTERQKEREHTKQKGKYSGF